MTPTTPTIAWTFVDDVAILVHGDRPPSDQEWCKYIGECTERLGSLRAGIVMTDGFGPNATQRGMVGDDSRFAKLPFAVISSSTVARGITTALRWLGSEIRAFAPDDVDRGFVYLDLPVETRERVRTALLELRRSLLTTIEQTTLADVDGDPDAYVMITPLARIREQMASLQQRMTKLIS